MLLDIFMVCKVIGQEDERHQILTNLLPLITKIRSPGKRLCMGESKEEAEQVHSLIKIMGHFGRNRITIHIKTLKTNT